MINTFLGSVGTDPMTGSINRKIYNYKISVDFNEQDEPLFTVSSYIRHPWKSEVSKTDLPDKQFDFSEDGLKAVLDHLNAEASEHLDIED